MATRAELLKFLKTHEKYKGKSDYQIKKEIGGKAPALVGEIRKEADKLGFATKTKVSLKAKVTKTEPKTNLKCPKYIYILIIRDAAAINKGDMPSNMFSSKTLKGLEKKFTDWINATHFPKKIEQPEIHNTFLNITVKSLSDRNFYQLINLGPLGKSDVVISKIKI